MTGEVQRPEGALPLSAAIAGLRRELWQAWWDAQDKSVRFEPAPVELTLEVAVTTSGEGSAGVHWWVLELGGKASRSKVATQAIKLTLEPRFFDAQGAPVRALIEADDEQSPSTRVGLDG